MKKNGFATRIIIIALAAMLAFGCLAACAKKTDKESIQGKWETVLDFGESIKKSMGSGEDDELMNMEELMANANFDNMKLKCLFEFKSDGTYEMTPDEESFKSVMKEFIISFMKPMLALFGGDSAEVSDEAILAALEAEDWDEAIKNFSESDEGNDMKSKGTYEIKDGLIIFTDAAEKDEKPLETKYTLTKNELKLELAEGAEGTEAMDKSLFPIVLKRVGK